MHRKYSLGFARRHGIAMNRSNRVDTSYGPSMIRADPRGGDRAAGRAFGTPEPVHSSTDIGGIRSEPAGSEKNLPARQPKR